MKKLFENVGGNKFKMLTENTEVKPVHETVVASGLKKVFENTKGDITYKQIEHVGFGYIKDMTTARNTALKEARVLAKEFNFTENEDSEKFVKREVNRPASEEKREVQIGKEIIEKLSHVSPPASQTDSHIFESIKKLAEELIKLHEQ